MAEYQDAYTTVIADLKRRRDEIDAMIAKLEAMATGSAALPESDDRSTKPQTSERPHGDFLGMSIANAAKIVLGKRSKPMSPAELVAALESGGLILSGGNKANVVGSVLNRRQKQVGDIVSPKRGKWALKEWYPNRNFGKKDAESAAAEKGESDTEESATSDDANVTNEPERLFEPRQIVPLRSAE
jgi:HB1, ASXL, restriction endonuclease HTH domain